MPSSRLDLIKTTFPALGRPTYNQSVATSTTSATSTALDAGQSVMLQADVDTFVTIGAVAVAANSFLLVAKERLVLTLGSGDTVISAILSASTGTLKIFTLA